MIDLRTPIVGIAALALGSWTTVSQAQDIRALVIGIDAYDEISVLYGAVNDAVDIANTLEEIGASDVTLLLDHEASRDAILANWRRLNEEAAPGDIVIVTYAGHGGQEAEILTDFEDDGLNDTWLLAGFEHAGPGNYERIIDDEINDLVMARQDITTILVSDSCHSGTMTRSIDSRVAGLPTRFASYPPIENDTLPPPPPPPAMAIEEEEVPYILFSAVREQELAPEIRIDGEPRGALSYTFARAITGLADREGDNGLSKREVEEYIRAEVLFLLQGRQTPQVFPRGQGDRIILSARGVEPPASSPPVQETPSLPPNPDTSALPPLGELPPLPPLAEMPTEPQTGIGTSEEQGAPGPDASASVQAAAADDHAAGAGVDPTTTPAAQTAASDTATPAASASLAPELAATAMDWPPERLDALATAVPEIAWVDNPRDADFLWDWQSGDVLNALGDIVAQLPALDAPDPAATPEILNDVMRRWAVLHRIRDIRRPTGMTLSFVDPEDPSEAVNRAFMSGDRAVATIEDRPHPFFTMFNIGSDGTVNFLYPLAAYDDPVSVDPRNDLSFSLTVTPPYGSDHLIVVSTASEADALHRLLAALDGNRMTDSGATSLIGALDRLSGALAVHGFYSRPAES